MNNHSSQHQKETQPPSKDSQQPSKNPQLPSKNPQLPLTDPQHHSKDPQLPSKDPQLPSKDPEHQKDPQHPSKNPQLPSRDPQLPSKNPQHPSKNPQLPSRDPQLPSKNPQLPLTDPQHHSKNPQLPSKNPQLPSKDPELPSKDPEHQKDPQHPSKNPQLPSKDPEHQKDPQHPSKNPQLPSKDPQLSSKDPQLPSKNPQLPSKDPEHQKDPQLPSKNPQLPSKDPQLPSKNPQLPLTDPQHHSKDPQLPSKDPEHQKDPQHPSKNPQLPSKNPLLPSKDPEHQKGLQHQQKDSQHQKGLQHQQKDPQHQKGLQDQQKDSQLQTQHHKGLQHQRDPHHHSQHPKGVQHQIGPQHYPKDPPHHVKDPQHHTYGRSGLLQPTALRCFMDTTTTMTSTTNTTTTTGAYTPFPLQRSATTMTQDDLHEDMRRTLTRRPESYCEAKRKSDPSQDTNKSGILNFFARIGSGKFVHSLSPGSKKGNGGHGGQASSPASRKEDTLLGTSGTKHHAASPGLKKAHDRKSEPRGYKQQAGATFYELTHEKGEAVGELTALEISRNRKSDPGGRKKHGAFSRGDNKGSANGVTQKPESGHKNLDPGISRTAVARKGPTPPREAQKASTKTTEATAKSGVPQDGHRNAGSSHPQHPDSKGDLDGRGGTLKAADAQRGRSGHPEAQKDTGRGREAVKHTRKKSIRSRKFFRSGPQCAAGHEDGTTTEEEVDGGGGVGGGEQKWARHGSFRGHFGGATGGLSSASGDPSHSDTELGKLSAAPSLLDGECGSVGSVGGEGSLASERGLDVGRVSAWATSFEKLLEDPAGLHTFAEFLKKEYSHENIYFWTACERYKRLATQEEQQATAREIFERHLYSGAPEPVNVDSQARQDAQDGLRMPTEDLFAQAQKQIFNLMKFDSYSRFLKSGLYTDCLSRERRGQPLPYPGDHTLDPDLRIGADDPHVKLKKSRSDADERRRKSLLPKFSSRKDRSKSKDRGEAEYRRHRKHHQHQRHTSDSSSIRSISGSQTSLNSSDIVKAASRESLISAGDQGSISGGEGGSSSRSRSSSNTITCRVFLPDSSKSVVLLRPAETIREAMARVVERRGLPYTDFEVFLANSGKLLSKDEEALALKDRKVRLEPRVWFQLVLPGQRALFLKADPSKAIGDKLKPLLSKAGYKMDLLHVHKDGEEKAVNLKGPISDLDGAKVIVQTKEDVREWGIEGGRHKRRGGSTNSSATNTTTNPTSSLDDITNRVFQDLRNGKMERFEDFSVIDLDARSSRTDSSDKSSGIRDFSRRNSFGIEKDSGGGRMFSKHRGGDLRGGLHHPSDHPLAKRRGVGGGGGGGGVTTADNDNELYEGLKRAQRSRLDDQRGTEINAELPEFLKNDKKQETTNNEH